MSKPRSTGRVANSLVALSSAAVMAVYSAGYLRTRAAADKLRAAERPRIVAPLDVAVAAPPSAILQPSAASTPSPLAVKPAATKSAAVALPSPVTQTTSPSASPAATPTAEPIVSTPIPTAAAPSPSPLLSPSPTPSATATPTPAPTPTPAAVYKDGTFSGWGTSRHGDIEATVVIERGRITSAAISQCLTRYSCSWVAHLQGQVVTRQSAEVDYVTGATQSTNAFYYAVVQALSKAK